jgi:hypothetical protein
MSDKEVDLVVGLGEFGQPPLSILSQTITNRDRH